MLWTILGLIVIGLIAGLIARAVIPGKQSMGILLTIVLGIVGSFVGGFLGFLLFGSDPNGGFLQPAGIIGSIIGAIIVLGIYVFLARRRGTERRNAEHRARVATGTGPAQLRLGAGLVPDGSPVDCTGRRRGGWLLFGFPQDLTYRPVLGLRLDELV